MPATRSKQKDTGKAGAPKTPAKAAPKAASRATPRSKAKQAANVSTSSDPPASSSPAKTRSRAPKAPAALTQDVTSSDPPPSSPAKTRSSKGKATNAPDQSKSSSGPPPTSPANTRSGKRKAAAALEQTASSPPAKTRRQSARVASRASTAEPVAVVPISEDVCEEEYDVGKPGRVSQPEGQDTDSSLSSIDSNLFDEETKNKAGDQKPEVKDVPMVDADPEPNTSTIITAANPSPNRASQSINDTTVAKDQGQKSEVVGAPGLTFDLEPKPSTTTTTVAQVLDLVSAVQANNNTTDTTDGSQKSHEEAETLKATTESGASLATTAEDTKGPASSQKATSSTKATSSGGRNSRAKASTSKATTKSTASKKASTSKKALDPMLSPQVSSDANATTVEDETSHAKGATSRVDSTATTAEEASKQTPAPDSADDNTTAGAQYLKSPSNDKSEPGTLKTSEVDANEPEQIKIVKDNGGAAVTEQSQAETLEAPGKDLYSQPTSAGGEATCMSDSGANITPAPVPGNSPQHKDLPEPEVRTSAATPSPRLPLATSSISPLSGAVNPYPPITPNATSETGSNVLVESGPRQAQQNGSPSPPEELVLAGQSFKVLWPVYEDLRKLIELKDDQGKEVVDAERKLLWKLYEQCRGLKSQLDEHERRKNERKKT